MERTAGSIHEYPVILDIYIYIIKRTDSLPLVHGKHAVSESAHVQQRTIARCALPQLAVWDFWRDSVRASGIFLRKSLSKVAAFFEHDILSIILVV
jgi:hypothetical protein